MRQLDLRSIRGSNRGRKGRAAVHEKGGIILAKPHTVDLSNWRQKENLCSVRSQVQGSRIF